MIPSIKAEFRKVFSVRSTYIMLAIALLLVIFFGFFVVGMHSQRGKTLSPTFLDSNISGAIMTVTFFGGLVGVLLVTHEYRYNTIMYSLTNTNSRSKVFFSKILIITAFSLLFTVVISILAPLMIFLGVHAHGIRLVPQTFYYRDLAWRCLFYGWGYAMAAVVLAFIIRNQIATIVTLLIGPTLVDGILSLWLKQNIVYLPFDSLQNVLGSGRNNLANAQGSITPFHSLLVVMAYLIFAWLVAWLLFLRRDAATNAS